MLTANQHHFVGNPQLLQRREFFTKVVMLTAACGGKTAQQIRLWHAIQVPEGDLAGPLTQLVAAHPGVSVGSYPNVRAGDTRYKVKVMLEARDEQALDAAATALQAAVACVQEVGDE